MELTRQELKQLGQNISIPRPEPEPTYLVRSPGRPVRFTDGKVIHMSRAARRRNKIYYNSRNSSISK